MTAHGGSFDALYHRELGHFRRRLVVSQLRLSTTPHPGSPTRKRKNLSRTQVGQFAIIVGRGFMGGYQKDRTSMNRQPIKYLWGAFPFCLFVSTLQGNVMIQPQSQPRPRLWRYD